MMPYVIRDDSGEIAAVYSERQDFTEEELQPGDPQLVAFIACNDPGLIRRALEETDADFLRVVEDVINILLEKNLILLSDFPKAARSKILGRNELRKRLQTPFL